jgi:protein phosphatase
VVVADIVDETDGAVAEPIIVGSAADHPRGAFSRLRNWAQRDEVDPNEHLVDPDIDPEELRYAPREPGRFRWLVRGIILVVVIAVIAGLAKLAYDWTQQQYYVSASGDNVAVFKGVQADLPLVSMHEVYETNPLLLTQLPDYRREQVVEGLAADDLEDARSIVAQLTQMADACADQAAAASSAASAASASSASAATKTTKKPPNKPADGKTDKPRDTGKPRTSSTPPAETDTEQKKPRSAQECSGAEPSSGSGTPADAPQTSVATP